LAQVHPPRECRCAPPRGSAAMGKRCNWCKNTLPLHSFSTRLEKGIQKHLSVCKDCKPVELASKAKYNKSAKGKTRGERYDKSEAGLAARERQLPQRREHKAAANQDEGFRMAHMVARAANKLINKPSAKSPTFVARTSFKSETHFRAHIRKSFRPGFTMANHGSKWHIEHKVPVEAYDFANPEDVKRCWSPENVRTTTSKENAEKSFKIIDELCGEVGAARFPLSWNGAIPTAQQKEAFYASARARWAPQPASDAATSSADQYASSSADDANSADDSDE